jgi:hypothetical protein
MAIKADGSLWAWGRNWRGQLGNGETSMQNVPVRIMDDVTFISAGESHTMAIKSDDSLWAWGGNWASQLGDGTTTDRRTPVLITDRVLTVSSGTAHTMAVKLDGSLWVWGMNDAGQLGDGTTTNRRSPVRIMEGVAYASAGETHSMAIRNDGSLWAWGSNYLGQLGDRTLNNRLSPVRIATDARVPAAPVRVSLDGRRLAFDVPAQMINNRTMVPLRGIFEAMGATVRWDNATQTVTATKGDTVVVMRIGDTSPTVNGRVVPIDQPGVVVDGRTLAPLRFVAEAFGGTVRWDGATWTASITS